VGRFHIAAGLVAAFAGLFLASPAQGQETAAPTLSLPDTEKVQTLKFGTSRDHATTGFTLDVEGAADPKNPQRPNASVRGDMVSAEGNRIQRSRVTVSRVEPNGTGGLDVDVRVDPGSAPAGRYTATVQFGGAGYKANVPVTLQATLKDSAVLPIVLAFVGWIAGTLLKLVTDLFGTATVNVQRKTIGEWLKAGGWSMLVGGFLGAATAFAVAYLPNDIWGASSSDWLKLLGAAFAAATAGNTAADGIAGALSSSSRPVNH
jgi:hypothetical protein